MYALACLNSTYACFMHAYAYLGMHVQARVLETIKDKCSTFKIWFWNESHIILVLFQTSIYWLQKAIHGTFSKHIENPKGEKKDSLEIVNQRGSFSQKYPQVIIFLIEAFSWPWSSSFKFTNHFLLEWIDQSRETIKIKLRSFEFWGIMF